jgi:hypothetical protein
MTYSHGKISPDDEGDLDIGLAADKENGVVRIMFPKPVIWLALEKKEALTLARVISEKAEQLR